MVILFAWSQTETSEPYVLSSSPSEVGGYLFHSGSALPCHLNDLSSFFFGLLLSFQPHFPAPNHCTQIQNEMKRHFESGSKFNFGMQDLLVIFFPNKK